MLGFDADGDPIMSASTMTEIDGAVDIISSSTTGLTNVVSIAALKLLGSAISDNDSISVLGYYAEGDGGGGTFYWDATSTDTDNGGTIIQATGVTTGRWMRVFSGAVNVKWFGAKGDGVTNNNTTILAAADYATEGELYFPAGEYTFSDLTGISFHQTILSGDGRETTILRYTATTGTAITLAGSSEHFVMRDISIQGPVGGTHSSGWGIIFTGNTRYAKLDNASVKGFANGIWLQVGWNITIDHTQIFGTSNYTDTPAAWASGTIGLKLGKADVSTHTGDGVTDTFAASSSDVSSVIVGGKLMKAITYNVVGSTVVFNDAPANGDSIRILADAGGVTTTMIDNVYISNFETDLYNNEVTGLVFSNLILESCMYGLETELWVFGSLYAENIYDSAIVAYMPVQINCINNRSYWHKAGATGSVFGNILSEQGSFLGESSQPDVVIGNLTSSLTIDGTTAAPNLIVWEAVEDGYHHIEPDGKIHIPGRGGFYRLTGIIQISSLTVGDDVAVTINTYNNSGSLITSERLRHIAIATEIYTHFPLNKVGLYPAGTRFAIGIGANDNSLEVKGADGNRESWVSIERIR
jgi:hypothetical protein